MALVVGTASAMMACVRARKRIAVARWTLEGIAIAAGHADVTPDDCGQWTHQARSELPKDLAGVCLAVRPCGTNESTSAAGDRDDVSAVRRSRLIHPGPGHAPEQLVAVSRDDRLGARNAVRNHRRRAKRGEQLVSQGD